MESEEILVGISSGMFHHLHLQKLEIVDVFAEIIDNSISSANRLGVPASIEIVLNSDSIKIIDNGIGFSRSDMRTALVAADTNSERIDDSTYSVYGYGLKGSAFWLGKVLKIESVSVRDRQRLVAECDIRELPVKINPAPTVKLHSMDLLHGEIEKPVTSITITELYSRNYTFTTELEDVLRTCLGRVYHPLLSAKSLEIVMNGIPVYSEDRDYVKAYFHNKYKKVGKDKYVISKEVEGTPPKTWKIEVNESIEDYSSGVVYSVKGVIGMKPSQSDKDNGIRVYRRNRGILGCNKRFNDFNPYSFRVGTPDHLFLIGDLHVSDSFAKPLMGNDLPDGIWLKELLDEIRRKNSELFSQIHNFRKNMLNASFETESVVQPPPVTPPIGKKGGSTPGEVEPEPLPVGGKKNSGGEKNVDQIFVIDETFQICFHRINTLNITLKFNGTDYKILNDRDLVECLKSIMDNK